MSYLNYVPCPPTKSLARLVGPSGRIICRGPNRPPNDVIVVEHAAAVARVFLDSEIGYSASCVIQYFADRTKCVARSLSLSLSPRNRKKSNGNDLDVSRVAFPPDVFRDRREQCISFFIAGVKLHSPKNRNQTANVVRLRTFQLSR